MSDTLFPPPLERISVADVKSWLAGQVRPISPSPNKSCGLVYETNAIALHGKISLLYGFSILGPMAGFINECCRGTRVATIERLGGSR
jgi:hypothetical protein